jgi:hypothetical protein
MSKRRMGVATMTTAEKNQAIRDANTKMANPANSAGIGANERMRKETTAASKDQARQKVNMNSQEAQKAMQKAATP